MGRGLSKVQPRNNIQVGGTCVEKPSACASRSARKREKRMRKTRRPTRRCGNKARPPTGKPSKPVILPEKTEEKGEYKRTQMREAHP